MGEWEELLSFIVKVTSENRAFLTLKSPRLTSEKYFRHVKLLYLKDFEAIRAKKKILKNFLKLLSVAVSNEL